MSVSKGIEIIKKDEFYDKFLDAATKDKYIEMKDFGEIYKKDVGKLEEGTKEVQLKQIVDIEYENGTYGSKTMNPDKLQTLMPMSITSFVTPSFAEHLHVLIMAPEITKITDTSALSNLYELEHLQFPSGLRILGDYTCKNLKRLKTVVFPGQESLISMGVGCFSGCESLEEIVLPKFILRPKLTIHFNYDYIEDEISTKEDTKDYPEQVCPGIPDETFMDCKKLKRINLKNCQCVGVSAFEGCHALETIYHVDDLEHILERAFRDTVSLRILNGCKSLKSIGIKSFDNSGIEGVYIVTNNSLIIGKNAFERCRKLKECDIKSPQLYLLRFGFAGCENMFSCKLEHLIEVYARSFIDCGVTELDLKNADLLHLPTEFCRDCPNLFKVVLPRGLQHYQEDAISKCPNLAEMECECLDCEVDGTRMFTSYEANQVPIRFYVNPDSLLVDYCRDVAYETGGQILYI